MDLGNFKNYNFLNSFKKGNFPSRIFRAWDYHPEVGLVMAGSAFPNSKAVERSRDHGQTFTREAPRDHKIENEK